MNHTDDEEDARPREDGSTGGSGDGVAVEAKEALHVAGEGLKVLRDVKDVVESLRDGAVSLSVFSALNAITNNEAQLERQRRDFSYGARVNDIRKVIALTNEPYPVTAAEVKIAEWAVKNGELRWREHLKSVILPDSAPVPAPLLTCRECGQFTKAPATKCRACKGSLSLQGAQRAGSPDYGGFILGIMAAVLLLAFLAAECSLHHHSPY